MTTSFAAPPRGRLRRLAEALTTPLLPEGYLDLLDPLRSAADLRGRIVAVRPETGDAVTLVIRPGRGWRGHTPGQYVRLGVDVDGVRRWRPYSLTSPPGRRDGRISVTVKAIPDGTVSTHLVRRARRGMLVQLDQAQGEFVVSTPAPAKILFLTAGSGITPVMGMLRSGVHERSDVVVLHSAPTAADVMFGSWLRALAASGGIRLVELHTATDGRLDVANLGDLVADYAERETWACGPTGLLDAVETHWHDHGIADRLRTERFRPALVEPGDGGTVAFTRSAVEVGTDGATSILDAGEQSDVLMPSGCRMGICFGCVAPLREGAVRDLRTGELTSAEPGHSVLIQTCVSAAAGSCTIDL